MIPASQLRAGMAVRYENQSFRVLAADYHPGQGKMGGVTHARLKNLDTGTQWEHSFRAELKLEELPVEKRAMDFLYGDEDNCFFMDPETFEQVGIAVETVGDLRKFLEPQMRLPVDFVDGAPVGVQFPDSMEVRVADTAPPVHAHQDSTWKTATLANGVEVMVPQFIKTDDVIRLHMDTLKYAERAKSSTGAGH
ncbi:MAG: elongation factor P [Acidimicrobiia bacterium]|nr:elongation factor P [Acidimicrobiia bacterium]